MENQQLHNQDNPCPQKSISDRKFVIFDLDGTLIDSFECVLRCVNKTLESFNLPTVIIPSSERNGDIALIFSKVKGIIDGCLRYNDFKKRFDEFHYIDCIESIVTKHSMVNIMTDYYNEGIEIIILTNKYQPIAERICAILFKPFNMHILGRLDCIDLKSKECHLNDFMQKKGLNSYQILYYYGDSNQDKLISEKLKIPFRYAY